MKKFIVAFLIVALGVSSSSCMMMMPGHMSGSMQEGHNHVSSDVKTDPVCGKQIVDENSLSYEYQGKNYYFDTEECLSVFKDNPDHFLQKQNNHSPKNTWTKVGMIGGGIVMTSMMILMLARVF
ncbi:MAG: YHS domain-containing protein [Bacteroidota bacterium]|nr:hypothetical protein [Odoribacter sp.]MDP3643987.1 YHS domain-containing protein [Bacteroidota bacterium]